MILMLLCQPFKCYQLHVHLVNLCVIDVKQILIDWMIIMRRLGYYRPVWGLRSPENESHHHMRVTYLLWCGGPCSTDGIDALTNAQLLSAATAAADEDNWDAELGWGLTLTAYVPRVLRWLRRLHVCLSTATSSRSLDSRVRPSAQLTMNTSSLYRRGKFGWNLDGMRILF